MVMTTKKATRQNSSSRFAQSVAYSPHLPDQSQYAQLMCSFKKSLNCVCFNRRSTVLNCQSERFVGISKPGIVIMAESWLPENDPDSLLSLNSSQNAFRCDQGFTRNGGVACLQWASWGLLLLKVLLQPLALNFLLLILLQFYLPYNCSLSIIQLKYSRNRRMLGNYFQRRVHCRAAFSKKWWL